MVGCSRVRAASAETAAWHKGFGPVLQSVMCGAIAVHGEVMVVALGTTLRLQRAAGQAGSPTDWVIRVR